jgi:hypothetical protein
MFYSINPKLKWYDCVRVGMSLGFGAALVINNRLPFLCIVFGYYNIIIGPHY